MIRFVEGLDIRAISEQVMQKLFKALAMHYEFLIAGDNVKMKRKRRKPMKRKKLTASMIALVMSVSLPMTIAYAANWYLEDGSVTVNADNSGQTVTQGSTSTPDEAPVITQRIGSSAETSNTPCTINASGECDRNVTISIMGHRHK
ncbi:MAG: hypothetical protein ACLU3U_13275 [Gallintestinimicrobium sp.]